MTEITNEAWSAKPESFTGHDHPSFGWAAYVSNGQYIVAKAWGTTDAEAKQRAHLIAAAPELYEAASKALAILVDEFGPYHRYTPEKMAIEAVRAALAKARGEQL